MRLYDNKYYMRGKNLIRFQGVFDILNYIGLFNFKKHFNRQSKVLEVGCGDGKICNYLSNCGFNIDAIDISDSAIKLAKKYGSNVNFFVGDVFDLKCKSEKYDVVYSLHVMEHIVDIDNTLKEIRRIIKKTGKLIIRIPNSDSFEAKIAGNKWFHYDEPYHVNHWGYGEFRDVLINNGFSCVKVNFGLLEYKQVLLYSILSYFGFDMGKIKSRLLVLPLQIVFVPISILLGFVFKNSGTVEFVVE